MKKIAFLITALTFSVSWGQNGTTTSTPSLFQELTLQNVGPTVMSGRVVDVAVNPENPIEFYVAYASGGLWYSNTNGLRMEPVMDTAPTLNCGSVFVDWKSGMILVGTGEINSSRSSYAGIGLLQSFDKGKTWKNIGLTDSHHISKILVNPKNSQEIVVGVAGHLYTKNKERGVFKTTDGGKSWQQVLFVNDETGVIDMAVAESNFTVMYASAWQKDRKAHNFNGNGKASGIYKSTDAGLTWQLISTPESGFPSDEFVGRIGLSAFTSDIIYAVMDNQKMRPSAKKEKDPNDEDPEVIGAEVFKSINGGKTWVKTNTSFIDDFYSSYGYYFGDITVDPKNQERIYITGVPLLFSDNGGKTFQSIDGDNVHSDHHVVWINPNNPNHLVNGNDGGLNITYDNGKSWQLCNSIPVGQFYAVNVDEQEPYNIYGGLQDNGVWVGASNYSASIGWQQEGKYPYARLMGGDGMQIQIDKRNPNIVFTGYQYGSYYRINRADESKSKFIAPKAKKGDKPYRYNWQSPILLSSHNQDILYLGSNFLHRSMNQGDTWTAISPDLTQGGKQGNVAFGTLTTISESPFEFGVLYTGSDDGLVQFSNNGGANWKVISTTLPQNLWVSRVVASAHKKERVYVTLNGYRNDDFTSYVYVSEDAGQTWKSIANNLPASPVNVILEDSVLDSVLYVGTDNGLYISVDGGASWQDFSNGMPSVAVHDLVIQKKAKDLIVGTHGRSVYKVSLKQVQELKKEVLDKTLYVYEIKNTTKSERWGSKRGAWGDEFIPKNELWFYTNSAGNVSVQLENPAKEIVYTTTVAAQKGLNKVVYDLVIDKAAADKWMAKDKKLKINLAKNGKYYLPVAKYIWSVAKDKEKVTTPFEIVAPK